MKKLVVEKRIAKRYKKARQKFRFNFCDGCEAISDSPYWLTFSCMICNKQTCTICETNHDNQECCTAGDDYMGCGATWHRSCQKSNTELCSFCGKIQN